MKELFFLLFILVHLPCKAQDNSDLYNHIDSLIQYEIQYVYDSTTSHQTGYKWDSTKTSTPHYSPNSPTPTPIILLDGLKIVRSKLNNYNLEEIADILCYKKQNDKMLALFGTSSRNGVIMIETKKFRERKQNGSQQ